MNVLFTSGFGRDLRSLRDATLRQRVERAIDAVKAAAESQDIPQLAKMTGYTIHYRIRVGDHRLGVTIEGDTVTFVRCLPRDQIYRQFP